MHIPKEFEKKYRKLMSSSEYSDFMTALNNPPVTGLRVNRLKISLTRWNEIAPFGNKPVPWSEDGFYIDGGSRPGAHPYYHAGLYYIQEPSAMFPAETLGAGPGDRVLDLCAAPGGKTVRLAAGMKNQGILLSNDINPKRIKALVKNIEINGIVNAVVTNESPEKLADEYENYFNKILLDVPCSGEGMFRKDADALKSWNRYKSDELQGLQREIFKSAYRMLSPGGTLVYSTCTFNPEENEQNIAFFLKTNPDLFLIDIPKKNGIEPGRPDWADGNPELEKAARLWPHKIKGEGHFTALMGRTGEAGRQNGSVLSDEPGNSFRCEPGSSFNRFCDRMLVNPPQGVFHKKGEELYILPAGYEYTQKLRAVKTGLYLGTESHHGFEPSQSFIMAMKWENLKHRKSFSLSDPDLMRYLKGETLLREGEYGYIALGVDGFPLGWGKIGENGLKNLYPKGWRKAK